MPVRPKSRSFPKNFVWGVAAAAPQIEGAAFEDGKGESTWDRFSRTSPKVLNQDNLDVACDHYHRFDSDFKLMKSLGIQHYRLSIAWPRAIPEGVGAVNEAGLAFYDRLIDSMLKHGITPWVTLFHWDTPQALEELGGWRNREIVDAYGDYAKQVVWRLGDRVKRWFTLNEIPCFTELSYAGNLDKAPGIARPAKEIHQAIHNACMAHGAGVQAVRAHGGKGAKVGLVDNLACVVPLTETEADIEAARQAFLDKNSRILGVVASGKYSAAYKKRVGADAPDIAKGDLELISQPTDFVGLNVYTGCFVRAAKGKPGWEELPFPPEYPSFCKTKWLKPMPQCIYWALRFTHECYGWDDLYITENGIGFMDESPNAKGEILDLYRREYYRAYLSEVQRAAADKVPVKGYFAWSVMDNYEWADGYSTRFGLCYTDYKTQKRTPKLSMGWYQAVMQANAIV
jgi:beta-glucosidase